MAFTSMPTELHELCGYLATGNVDQILEWAQKRNRERINEVLKSEDGCTLGHYILYCSKLSEKQKQFLIYHLRKNLELKVSDSSYDSKFQTVSGLFTERPVKFVFTAEGYTEENLSELDNKAIQNEGTAYGFLARPGIQIIDTSELPPHITECKRLIQLGFFNLAHRAILFAPVFSEEDGSRLCEFLMTDLNLPQAGWGLSQRLGLLQLICNKVNRLPAELDIFAFRVSNAIKIKEFEEKASALEGHKPPRYGYRDSPYGEATKDAIAAFFIWVVAMAAYGYFFLTEATEESLDTIGKVIAGQTLPPELRKGIATFLCGAFSYANAIAVYDLPACRQASFNWFNKGLNKPLTLLMHLIFYIAYLIGSTAAGIVFLKKDIKNPLNWAGFSGLTLGMLAALAYLHRRVAVDVTQRLVNFVTVPNKCLTLGQFIMKYPSFLPVTILNALRRAILFAAVAIEFANSLGSSSALRLSLAIMSGVTGGLMNAGAQAPAHFNKLEQALLEKQNAPTSDLPPDLKDVKHHMRNAYDYSQNFLLFFATLAQAIQTVTFVGVVTGNPTTAVYLGLALGILSFIQYYLFMEGNVQTGARKFAATVGGAFYKVDKACATLFQRQITAGEGADINTGLGPVDTRTVTGGATAPHDGHIEMPRPSLSSFAVLRLDNQPEDKGEAGVTVNPMDSPLPAP